MEERGTPCAQLLRTVPQRERMSPEDLVRIADFYLVHLQGSTGKSSALRRTLRSDREWRRAHQPDHRSAGPRAVRCADLQL